MQATLDRTIAGTEIQQVLSQLSLKRATGELIITREAKQWNFYFILGYLRYATGGNYRARRWYRSIKLHSPELFSFKLKELVEDEPWEYQILWQSLKQDQIIVPQAREVVISSVQEILFTLLNSPSLSVRWVAKKQPTTPSDLLIKTDKIITPVQKLLTGYSPFSLSKYCPNLSPILKQPVASKITSGTSRFFEGKYSLWDIAIEARRPITDIIQVLLPFEKQNSLELLDIGDLTPPIDYIEVAQNSQAQKPLIACIDDSSAFCHSLEKILTPNGYRVLKIQKPLEEMSTLVKEKPALIFLDLMMPEVNGYNLCNFLRQTQIFQETPIIILTSSNDSIDRMMTEIAGATGYLNKPPEEKMVLEILKTHLPSRKK